MSDSLLSTSVGLIGGHLDIMALFNQVGDRANRGSHRHTGLDKALVPLGAAIW